MQNIDILGMKLRDCSAEESLNLAESFLQKGVIHTIFYLTGSVLLESEKNQDQKAWIESADLTLWGDTKSLHAAGITAANRYREVNDKEFLQGFLQKLAKDHRAVLVLSDTEERAEALKRELKLLQEGVTFVGTLPLNCADESREDMINEINLIAPTAVITRMSFGAQLKWLADSKALLNTEVWIAMPEQMSCIWKKEILFTRIVNQIRNAIFRRLISKYMK